MSLSNATENAALKMFLQGTDPSYRAGATQYLAAFTADPGETASLAAEATYTGYSRLAITKSTAWTDNGSTFNNAVLMQLPVCTGGSSALTHFAVVDTASGAVNMMISGALGSTLNVSSGIQPQFAPGDLAIQAD
jgi:hypothetical protein